MSTGLRKGGPSGRRIRNESLSLLELSASHEPPTRRGGLVSAPKLTAAQVRALRTLRRGDLITYRAARLDTSRRERSLAGLIGRDTDGQPTITDAGRAALAAHEGGGK